jgi:transposase-like protein
MKKARCPRCKSKDTLRVLANKAKADLHNHKCKSCGCTWEEYNWAYLR